jgi:hypothetical protein
LGKAKETLREGHLESHLEICLDFGWGTKKAAKMESLRAWLRVDQRESGLEPLMENEKVPWLESSKELWMESKKDSKMEPRMESKKEI